MGGIRIPWCFGGHIRIEDNTIKGFEAYQPDESPIRLDWCENVVITGNTFIDVYNRKAHVDAVIYLRFSPTDCIIRDNDYTESGVSGGVEIHPDWDPANIDSRKFVNPICVWLSQWSSNNLVAEKDFPKKTTALDQIFDEGIDNVIIED
jgi:hypothetical protein